MQIHTRPGDTVTRGQPLLTLHTATPERFERARQALEGAVCISAPGSHEAAQALARRRAGVVLEVVA